ncbi:MAG: hypothetical protein AAGI91_17705 [Bacteroidota bacterium]
MMPEQEDHHDPDLTPQSASSIRKMAGVMGVVAGVLFLVAFGIGLARSGEANFLFLGMGVLFLLFPFLVRKTVRADS